MKEDKLRKPYSGFLDFEKLNGINVPIHKFWDEKPEKNSVVIAIGLSLEDPFDEKYDGMELYDQCYECAYDYYIDTFCEQDINYFEKGIIWMFWIDTMELEKELMKLVDINHVCSIAIRQLFREVMLNQREKMEDKK